MLAITVVLLVYFNFKHLAVIDALNREILHQAEHSHKALVEKMKLEKENLKLSKKIEENPTSQSNGGKNEQ